MSSLLEQAIVDAKALKEAALKNAEATIIDKYSEEVKSTLNQLLEQEELGLDALLGGGEEAGLDLGAEAPSPGAEAAMEEEVEADEIAEGVPDAFTEDSVDLGGVNEGDVSEVTIDFKELAEALKSLREEVEGEETLGEGEVGDHSQYQMAKAYKDPSRSCPKLRDEFKKLGRALMVAPYDDGNREANKIRAQMKEVDKKYEDAGCKGRITEPRKSRYMEEEVDLDEDSIMEMVASMLSEEDEETLEEAPEDDDVMEEGEEDGELYEELSDGLLDAIMEKLTVDMGESLSGWAGRSADDTKYQMEKELARRRSTDMEEELEALKQAQEALVFENKKLKQNLANYQEVVSSLKENVQDVNLSNARLLYTNRTLGNTSLNERQKQTIVEAISKAGSVEEAKTIHETLQSTVSSTPKRRTQSLSEAITRPTSIIRASRKEEPQADPFNARMRKLAGIN